jgi:hypothetical protein
LTLTLCASLLAACGGGGDGGTGGGGVGDGTAGTASTNTSASAATSARTATPSTTPTPTATAAAELRLRAWSAATLLGRRNAGILEYINAPGHAVGLADNGTATSLYAEKDASGRYVLQAVRAHAGLAGGTPVWEAPQQLDSAGTFLSSLGAPRVVVSPAGHALAIWYGQIPCDRTTYNTLASLCDAVFAARRLATETVWEPAQRVKDSPLGGKGPAIGLINDRGEVAIVFPGASPAAGQSFGAFASQLSVAFRAAAEAGYRVESTPTLQLFGTTLATQEHLQAGLDNQGRLTIVSERPNDARTRDMVVLTGTIAQGLGSSPQAQPLEAYDGAVDLFGLKVGTDGTVAVAFRQDTPQRRNATMLAVRLPGATVWTVEDVTDTVGTLSTPDSLDFLEQPVSWSMAVPDNAQGDVLVYRECAFIRRTGGRWQAEPALQNPCPWGQNAGRGRFAMSRNGNFVFMDQTGRWAAYDPSTRQFDKRLGTRVRDAVPADYVLGVPQDPTNENDLNQQLLRDSNTAMAVAPSGVAVMLVRSTYSTMPSPAAPLGDVSGVPNLFGLFYR